MGANRFRKLTLNEKAEVLSTIGGEPICFRYENAKGQKFLVYAFIARDSLQTGAMTGNMRGWCRAAQLRSQLAWLSGREPDAVCAPSPDLYTLVKKDGDSLTVGVWTFCVDEVFCPQVHLGEEWGSVTAEVGEAMLNGRIVTLNDLPPFGFACFTVTK